MLSHDEILEKVISQFIALGNTAEEFGELLHDATMLIWHWQSDESRTNDRLRKNTARCRIRSFEGGAELLRLEDKFIQATR